MSIVMCNPRYLSISFFCFIWIFRKVSLGTAITWLYRGDVVLKDVDAALPNIKSK